MHKDYLGSILAISDEAGNKVEQRHYDAWGNLTHLQIGNGSIQIGRLQPTAYGLLLDRGYTSHEHLFEVGLIHMNGRLYDPLLRRFLNADEHIQDPYNTQNYNKYGYVYNNPLMYNDPSGEFVFTALAVWLGSKVLAAAVVGAVMGVLSYTVGLAVTGNLHQWSLGGALKSAFWGGVGGAVTFGIGSIFSSTSGSLTAVGQAIEKVVGKVGLSVIQGGTHAVAQGVLSVFQGGSFEQAFWSGAFGSLGASAFGAMAGDFASSAGGTIAFGAISGGIGAELSGGNFWEGAIIGGVVAGLNHVAHRQNPPPPEKSLLDTAGEWVTDYFDYNGDGQVAGWDYALGAVDVGITIFDIVTVPSGEGVAAHIALKEGAKLIAKGGAKNSSRILGITKRQLQAKFKHAADFGVQGNWSNAAGNKFNSAINQHINSKGVKAINGTYRGNNVIHYVNPKTGLNVISTPSGNFISGWKLNSSQLKNVINRGSL